MADLATLYSLFPRLDQSLIQLIHSEYPEDQCLQMLKDMNSHAEYLPVESSFSDNSLTGLTDVSAPNDTQDDLLESYASVVEDLSPDQLDQLRILRQMFPEITPAGLKLRLINTEWNTERAIDELLNKDAIASLSETGFEQFGLSKKEKKRQKQVHRIAKKNLETEQSENELYVTLLMDMMDGLAEKVDCEELWERSGKSVVRALELAKLDPKRYPVIDIPHMGTQSYAEVLTHAVAESKEEICMSDDNAKPKSASPNELNLVIKDSTPNKRAEGMERIRKLHDLVCLWETAEKSSRARIGDLSKTMTNLHHREAARTYGGKKHEALNDLYDEIVNYQTTGFRIDLHNVPTANAIRGVENLLSKWRQLDPCDRVPVEIITGQGKHSAGHIPKTKIQVKRLLSSGLWRYDELAGSFIVRSMY